MKPVTYVTKKALKNKKLIDLLLKAGHTLKVQR